MNKIQNSTIVLFFVLLIIPVLTFAQSAPLRIDNIPGTGENNALITCGNDGEPNCEFTQLIQLVQNGLNLVFAFGAFIAAGMFMYAGFLMLTAVGNMNQISQAKKIFTRVAVGFLIMFVSFLLVQQLLKNLKLSPTAQQVIGNIIDLK